VPQSARARSAGKRPAGDWPQWRGSDRSGVSPETGLLKQWPPGGPPLVWKATDLGSGYSSVAIHQGRAYTMGKSEEFQWVFALDLADGSQLWKRKIGMDYDNDKGGGPRGTPTVVDDALYLLSATGDLWCLAAADGTPRWQVNVLEQFGGENPKWGLSESPLVEGDLVIVNSGSPQGSLVAFDRRDGKLVWQSSELKDEAAYASAVPVTVGDVRQVLHFTGQAAVGVRASDGKLLWRYEKVANDTANCATPVVHDGYAFFTSGYDTGAALLHLTPQGEGAAAEEVYFTRDMMNHHGGVVLVGDHLYGFSGSILTCLDFMTGRMRWQDRSVGKGSIAAADGMLYLFSEGGAVGLAQATPEGYREVSRFQIPLGTPRKTWAHPVIAGGRLYLRNRSELLCYDVKA
jgi:outer membrane protein assembly factor BamB